MNMYKNVLLVGISTDFNAFQLALRVTPLKQNKNWATNRDLMYGNLLWDAELVYELYKNEG